ncbi:MAG: 5-oxoprolinase subunit PxpB [Planctomycetes bacterium]|nr:5-oxoprolinase subunit PxpB [Planctomycetota bacterium]
MDPPFDRPTLTCLGESAWLVTWGHSIDRETFARIARFTQTLDADPPRGLVEYVPAFTTVGVYFDPETTGADAFAGDLERRIARSAALFPPPPREVRIPVCYEDPFAIDLAFVAQYHGRTRDDVVARHHRAEYFVHMIGFVPGFPYLGGLDTALATPRHASPRLRVPIGSVGIADHQTGIYPIDIPGGWRIIGRTPLRLFRPEEREPALLRPGDVVRFEPIPASEFHATCEYSA